MSEIIAKRIAAPPASLKRRDIVPRLAVEDGGGAAGARKAKAKVMAIIESRNNKHLS